MEILLEGLNNENESNHFLRSLWASIRDHFGKCAWHYSPYKKLGSKQIILGRMNYKAKGSFVVSVRYKQKGNLVAVMFSDYIESDEIISDLKVIRELVKNSLDYKKLISKFRFSTSLDVIRGSIAAYSGKSFVLKPTGNSSIKLIVDINGYDTKDAEAKAAEKIKTIIEILTVSTNCLIIRDTQNDNDSSFSSIEINKYSRDISWIDAKPIADGLVQISEKTCFLIDYILSNDIYSYEIQLLLNSYAHFTSGRSLDSFTLDTFYPTPRIGEASDEGNTDFQSDLRFSNAAKLHPSSSEDAMILYMSSLEVASLIGASKSEKCDSCGQQVHSISDRVRIYVEKDSNNDPLVKIINSYYGLRSRYLHQGIRFVDNSYSGSAVPLLDSNTMSNAREYYQVSLLNLREWCSYLLRLSLEEMALEAN